ncbi:uncharacterized protein LOC122257593 [Penaeus japonicus]|uniref:uncharacterized protein LOC122257593 n=1 Tax=Penaeus japonicus TaxID=27405 RepID=UPI001C714CFB|nr:uncharacterized protein LOC122257593 [Penaeus japonicus]
MSPARVLLGLYLAAAASALLSTFYARWDHTRCLGAPLLTFHPGSVLQCSGACQSRGAECAAFTTHRTASGVRCELISDIESCDDVHGTHTYVSKAEAAQMATALGYMDIGNGKHCKFSTDVGMSWQESQTACEESFGTLFTPDSKQEFEDMRTLKRQQGILGTFWVGLRFDVNYLVDYHDIEKHSRDNTKVCATHVDDKDHIDYEDCDTDHYKICQLDP